MRFYQSGSFEGVPKFTVIMPAAGKSQRFKDKHYKKPFAVLEGRAVWLHSAEKFLNREDVIQLILIYRHYNGEHPCKTDWNETYIAR